MSFVSSQRLCAIAIFALAACRSDNPRFRDQLPQTPGPLRTGAQGHSTSMTESGGAATHRIDDDSSDPVQTKSSTSSTISSTSQTPTTSAPTSSSTSDSQTSSSSQEPPKDPFPHAQWVCPDIAYSCYLFSGIDEIPGKQQLSFQQMNDQMAMKFKSDANSSLYQSHLDLQGTNSGIKSSFDIRLNDRATLGLDLGVRDLDCQGSESCVFFEFGSFFKLSYSSSKEELTATYHIIHSDPAMATTSATVPMPSQGSHYIRTGYFNNELLLSVDSGETAKSAVATGNSNNPDNPEDATDPNSISVRIRSGTALASEGRLFGQVGWMRIFGTYERLIASLASTSAASSLASSTTAQAPLDPR